MQFADAHGCASYACCLTVTKVVSITAQGPLLDAILVVDALRRPSRIIRTFMKKWVAMKKKKRWERPLLNGKANLASSGKSSRLHGGMSLNTASNGNINGTPGSNELDGSRHGGALSVSGEGVSPTFSASHLDAGKSVLTPSTSQSHPGFFSRMIGGLRC